LNFTKGKTFKALNFGSAYVYNAFRPVGESKTFAGKSNSQYLHHFITWTQGCHRHGSIFIRNWAMPWH
jgi:hypothetical protein